MPPTSGQLIAKAHFNTPPARGWGILCFLKKRRLPFDLFALRSLTSEYSRSSAMPPTRSVTSYFVSSWSGSVFTMPHACFYRLTQMAPKDTTKNPTLRSASATSSIHSPRAQSHSHPPRARPREGPRSYPLEIDYLDPDKILPVLIRRVA